MSTGKIKKQIIPALGWSCAKRVEYHNPTEEEALREDYTLSPIICFLVEILDDNPTSSWNLKVNPIDGEGLIIKWDYLVTPTGELCDEYGEICFDTGSPKTYSINRKVGRMEEQV